MIYGRDSALGWEKEGGRQPLRGEQRRTKERERDRESDFEQNPLARSV